MTKNAVVLQNIRKIYQQNNVLAVDNVSLRIRKCEFATILGPSGSGKSTLLNLMGGIESPDDGDIHILDQNNLTPFDWNQIRQQTIGFVFQNFNLFPTLSALENIEMPMFGVIKGRRNRRKRAKQLLERVGLQTRAGHKPAQLSGGECQRVAIARSLANSPEILLADEPTGNLDSKTSHDIVLLFEDINKQEKTTLIIVTHDKEIANCASLSLNFRDGKIASKHRNENTGK